jgi:magnesium-transporting ATPase (P-type)
VGPYSSAARNQVAEEVEEDNEDDNDLQDKHTSIAAILICVLIISCTLLLVQCSISAEISWYTSANIAAMVFIYGFPYILAIPSIWDLALVNAARQLKTSNVEVQCHDAIEEAASLDYLVMQTIGILDKPEELERNKRSIRALQAMGIKIVLGAGIGEEQARRIALETGILRPEHENICGAVVSGKDLQKIYNGQPTNMNYEITPEYLSVVYGATKEHRAILIDFLTKAHPGRAGIMNPVCFGSEDLKVAPPVATVGAVGSGDNDVLMLRKAKVSFSTNERVQDNP